MIKKDLSGLEVNKPGCVRCEKAIRQGIAIGYSIRRELLHLESSGSM